MQKYKEYIYQFILIVLLFIFMAFDGEADSFEWAFFFIAVGYVFSSCFISYVLLPCLYYKQRFWTFWIGVVFIIFAAAIVEELIWEKFFFHEQGPFEINGLIYSLADAIPFMTILVGFKFLWDANEKRKELDAMKQMIMMTEMQVLKSQINPHFLFNNLNNIYSYAIENSPKTPIIIHKLSEVLRYMLYECHDKFVPLKKEVEHIENFITLNEMQMEDRGGVSFKSDNLTHVHRVAPLVLIVFVENAFKHSLSSLSKDIEISVSTHVKDDILFFRCENNYSHCSNLPSSSKGIGLKNVEAQLKLLYPDAHKLEIKKDDNLYSVQLTINLKQSI